MNLIYINEFNIKNYLSVQNITNINEYIIREVHTEQNFDLLKLCKLTLYLNKNIITFYLSIYNVFISINIHNINNINNIHNIHNINNINNINNKNNNIIIYFFNKIYKINKLYSYKTNTKIIEYKFNNIYIYNKINSIQKIIYSKLLYKIVIKLNHTYYYSNNIYKKFKIIIFIKNVKIVNLLVYKNYKIYIFNYIVKYTLYHNSNISIELHKNKINFIYIFVII